MPVVPELNTNNASDSGEGDSNVRSPGVIASSSDSIGINSASAGWSPTACDGVVSASAFSTSARFHAGLSKTADAPSRQMARKAITNSGRLDDISATRSPGLTPRCSRVVAMPLDRASSCGSVYSRSSKASAIGSLTPCPHWPSSVHVTIENSVSLTENGILYLSECVCQEGLDDGRPGVDFVLRRAWRASHNRARSQDGVRAPGGGRDPSGERPACRSESSVLL